MCHIWDCPAASSNSRLSSSRREWCETRILGLRLLFLRLQVAFSFSTIALRSCERVSNACAGKRHDLSISLPVLLRVFLPRRHGFDAVCCWLLLTISEMCVDWMRQSRFDPLQMKNVAGSDLVKYSTTYSWGVGRACVVLYSSYKECSCQCGIGSFSEPQQKGYGTTKAWWRTLHVIDWISRT